MQAKWFQPMGNFAACNEYVFIIGHAYVGSPPRKGARNPLPVALELTFFRNALVSLAHALDAVLIIAAFRGQQPHDPVAASSAGAPDHTPGVVDVLADRKLVRLHTDTPARTHGRYPRQAGS